ncbi:PREDICTED: tripartite motif-containing protein 34-like [Amphimedon queenslandica]|uniref:RING-type domain-containing protein n=1 Tax=Amphimedon queenslandica TaxID=400682 RepID=A0A1X7VPC0_AMPQE|nr:PREDICTED: tripartite motif-containing protein 34-like [Amphimedon queenslandica]|eukprot:XP_019863045.1 PREDICTED: tripartite motif-containing protein 34-like [Amphimedon queenslandica]
MAGKLEGELQESLQCPVCLETLTDPRALPCIHNFCIACLEKVYSESQSKGESRDELECPTCRVKHPLPNGDVHKISKNYQLADVIELLRSHSNTSNNDDEVCNEVPPKKEKKKDEAKEEFLCDVHSKKQDMYCLKCQFLVCRSCISDPVHSDHEVIDHEDVIGQLMEEVKELEGLVNNAGSNIEEHLAEANALKKQESENLESCKLELTDYFDQTTSRLRERIKKAQEKLSEVETHQKSLSQMLEDVKISQNKQRDADIEELIKSKENAGRLVESAQNLLSSKEQYNSREAVSKASSIVKKMRSVVDTNTQFALTSDPIEYKFSSQKDPLQCELIDQSAIVVSGLQERARTGANTFTIKYLKKLHSPPEISVTIKLPNGRQCTAEEVKVEPVADSSNEWTVVYFLSSGGFLSLFTRRIIEISVCINAIEAKGSPFKVQYGVTKDLVLNPLI